MAEQKTPTFLVYAAVPGQGERQELTGIGLGYLHEDRRGLEIALHALPLGGRLVLREADDQDSHRAQRDLFDIAVRSPLSLKQRMDAYERACIEQCLIESGGRINTVLEWLAIPRRTLSEKMARLKIERRIFLDHPGDVSVDAGQVLPAASARRSTALRHRQPCNPNVDTQG